MLSSKFQRINKEMCVDGAMLKLLYNLRFIVKFNKEYFNTTWVFNRFFFSDKVPMFIKIVCKLI